MPAQQPILYSFRRCPCAIRARLALLQAGVVVELREVDLKRKPAELLALSPAATVPVLDLGGGEVLTQSLDIVHWALGQHDPNGGLTRGDAACDAHLVALTDGEFKQALDRTKYPERFAGQNTEQNADRSADASRVTADRTTGGCPRQLGPPRRQHLKLGRRLGVPVCAPVCCHRRGALGRRTLASHPALAGSLAEQPTVGGLHGQNGGVATRQHGPTLAAVTQGPRCSVWRWRAVLRWGRTGFASI